MKVVATILSIGAIGVATTWRLFGEERGKRRSAISLTPRPISINRASGISHQA